MSNVVLTATLEEALLTDARAKVTTACRVFNREVPSSLASILERGLASVQVQPLPDAGFGGPSSVVVFSIPHTTGLSGKVTVDFTGRFGRNAVATITFKLTGYNAIFHWVPGEGWSRN